ncbi:hypothetical protein GCM10023171_37450 [Microbacterium panaciterrae]|uniref:Uncharacterized protein n=2 Tax=Microbacterium panaciterrae TaxID=985759 RepID=A0ABP8PT92_9MICO
MRTQICPPDHKHGATSSCYQEHDCACAPCRTANAERRAAYRRTAAYGLPTSDFVSAQPAQTHIEDLITAGFTPALIAAMSDTSREGVNRIMRGHNSRRGTRRNSTVLIRRTTAERILAIAPDLRDIPAGHWISGRGVRRRIEALGTRGWSVEAIRRHAHIGPRPLSGALAGQNVLSEIHTTIAAVYEELWDQHPPIETYGQRLSYGSTIARASRNGWLPPLAWDDIDTDDEPPAVDHAPVIDHVAIHLALRGERVGLTEQERAIVLAQAGERQLKKRELAEIVGVTVRHVGRLRAAVAEAA